MINARKVAMLLGGILTATVATGCFGGGPGYSNNPYGYNSGYSSYGNYYPYGGYASGYSYPQNYRNSYSNNYQGRAPVYENRGEARMETRHSSIGRDVSSNRYSARADRSEPK
jgi:hypothetical protein